LRGRPSAGVASATEKQPKIANAPSFAGLPHVVAGHIARPLTTTLETSQVRVHAW